MSSPLSQSAGSFTCRNPTSSHYKHFSDIIGPTTPSLHVSYHTRRLAGHLCYNLIACHQRPLTDGKDVPGSAWSDVKVAPSGGPLRQQHWNAPSPLLGL